VLDVQLIITQAEAHERPQHTRAERKGDRETMSSNNDQGPELKLEHIMGALDVLFTLREELAQWLEEANDESSKEALGNVLRHVEEMESEYQRRREAAEKV